jgi:hypothetical protein
VSLRQLFPLLLSRFQSRLTHSYTHFVALSSGRWNLLNKKARASAIVRVGLSALDAHVSRNCCRMIWGGGCLVILTAAKRFDKSPINQFLSRQLATPTKHRESSAMTVAAPRRLEETIIFIIIHCGVVRAVRCCQAPCDTRKEHAPSAFGLCFTSKVWPRPSPMVTAFAAFSITPPSCADCAILSVACAILWFPLQVFYASRNPISLSRNMTIFAIHVNAFIFCLEIRITINTAFYAINKN